MTGTSETGVIRCESRISSVVVFARGALVTRHIMLPASTLSTDATHANPSTDERALDGTLIVDVAGVTPMAEPGSVRAVVVAKNRTVTALSMGLDFPRSGAMVGPSHAKVREIELDVRRLSAELGTLRDLRSKVISAQPSAQVRSTHGGARIRARFDAALATSRLVDELAASLDERERALMLAWTTRQRDLASARLDAEGAAMSQRLGAGHPTYDVRVALDGEGPLARLELTYIVAAARWWPLYSLRLTDAGRRATWWLEALVAQRSGEDWTGISLGLSTADLVRDARLPELASLRIGRAQSAARKGYRAVPEGLDRMFAGYDRFAPASLPAGDSLSSTRTTMTLDARETGALDALESLDEEEEDEPTANAYERQTETRSAVSNQREFVRSRRATSASDMPSFHASPQGGLSPSAAPMSASFASVAPATAMSAPKSRGGGGAATALLGAPFAAIGALADALSSSEMTRSEGGGGADATVSAILPATGWMDFDALELAAASSASRGTLVRATVPVGIVQALDRAVRGVEDALPAATVRDPRDARGLFDHRHTADGLVDVPSGPAIHRLVLASAATSPSLGWTTTPHATAEVFREVDVTNPFDTPLLAGPVDVYVDGSFLVTSSIDTIDRGGSARLGLGVEERIRVVRNVRVDEGTSGLLGGTTEVVHTVSIELASSLGYPAKVRVVERLPVTDDRNLEVRLLECRPDVERYDQSERGAPVRGGLRWTLDLPAGGKAHLSLKYRLSLPTKSEVVGGNRRD